MINSQALIDACLACANYSYERAMREAADFIRRQRRIIADRRTNKETQTLNMTWKKSDEPDAEEFPEQRIRQRRMS